MIPKSWIISLAGLFIVSFLGTSAWALGKKQGPPPPNPPLGSQWAEASTVGPQQARLTFDPAFPERDWWLKYQDESLNRYIQRAISGSPPLNIAMLRIDEARALVSQAVSQQLPSLSFNPAYNRIGLPGNIGGGLRLPSVIELFLLSFQASYEVDLFGRYRDISQSARQELRAIEEDSHAALLALEAEVATAYFNLLRADTLVASQQEKLRLLTRVLALKRNQQQVGLVSNDEVIRSDRDVAQAESDLTTFRQQQALFAHQLMVLTGEPPQAAAGIARGTLELVPLPERIEAGIPSELIVRRPDVLASEHRLQRAYLDVRAARKAFLPSIQLGGTLGAAGNRFSEAFKSDSRYDQQSVTINQPVFRGGDLRARLRQQQSRQKEQVERYRQTILQALQEVEDQLALLKTGYEHLESSGRRLALSEESLRLSREQYEQGLIPRLNLYQAESELALYRQIQAQSKADSLIASVNLFKALGGGF